MDRRSAIRAIALLVVLLVVSIVPLVAYPLSYADHRPASEAFRVAEPASDHRVSATIVADGEPVLDVDGRVVVGGPRYVRIREPGAGVTTERYRNASGDGTVYTRYRLDRSQLDRRLESLEDDPDRTVRRVERDGGTATIVTTARDPNADLAAGLYGAASVVATQLRLAGYARSEDADSADRDVRVLRPRDGWYDGTRPYRLSGTAGTVRLDPGTGVLLSADVRWTLTRNTPTYAHYMLNRRHATTQRIEYEHRTGDVVVDRPDWVARTQAVGKSETDA